MNGKIEADKFAHWREVPWDVRFETWAYPIGIISDRYGGTYSGGSWLAIAGLNDEALGKSLLNLIGEVDERTPNPWGSDTQAMDFWESPPTWIASGPTPDAALAALKEKNRDIDWPFDR